MDKEKAEQRKAQIIEATFRCIAEKGYENLTMNAISEYAQLSKGAIAYYFKTKEDILIAVINELDKRLFKAVDDKIGEKTSLEDHLRYRTTGSFEMARENPALFYVLMDFLSLGINRTEFKKVIQRFFKKYRKLSSAGAIPGMKAGFYRNVELKDFGAAMMGIYIGLVIQWIIDEEDIDFEASAKVAEDMIIKYIQDKPGSHNRAGSRSSDLLENKVPLNT